MKTTTKKKEKIDTDMREKLPYELSKTGMFLRKHPNGIGEIIDMKAVMK